MDLSVCVSFHQPQLELCHFIGQIHPPSTLFREILFSYWPIISSPLFFLYLLLKALYLHFWSLRFIPQFSYLFSHIFCICVFWDVSSTWHSRLWIWVSAMTVRLSSINLLIFFFFFYFRNHGMGDLDRFPEYCIGISFIICFIQEIQTYLPIFCLH